jgi:hypothetical protein
LILATTIKSEKNLTVEPVHPKLLRSLPEGANRLILNKVVRLAAALGEVEMIRGARIATRIFTLLQLMPMKKNRTRKLRTTTEHEAVNFPILTRIRKETFSAIWTLTELKMATTQATTNLLSSLRTLDQSLETQLPLQEPTLVPWKVKTSGFPTKN